MRDTEEISVEDQEFKIHFTISEYDPGDRETPPEEGGLDEIEFVYWWKGNKWFDITALNSAGLIDIDFTEQIEEILKNR
tara:strand:+ start:5367 stop:5603 length:237 start_codon:yes stop_codon:yes gene_type:complete